MRVNRLCYYFERKGCLPVDRTTRRTPKAQRSLRMGLQGFFRVIQGAMYSGVLRQSQSIPAIGSEDLVRMPQSRTKPKINHLNFHLLLINNNILQFNIPMRHFLPMTVLHRRDNPPKNPPHRFLRQFFIPLQIFFQIDPMAILHNHKGAAIVRDKTVEFGDIWVVQAAVDGDLAGELGVETLLLEATTQELFNGDGIPPGCIDRLVHNTITPFANLLPNSIPPIQYPLLLPILVILLPVLALRPLLLPDPQLRDLLQPLHTSRQPQHHASLLPPDPLLKDLARRGRWVFGPLQQPLEVLA